MHSQGPVLSKLHSLIQQGLRRCLASASDSSSGQRSSFHDWCDVQQPQQTCHTALELHEVLIQVRMAGSSCSSIYMELLLAGYC